jgi:chemotaxis protein MotB
MPEQQIIVRKKVHKGGHAHHGGSWKVAYADFVTAMMAFFLVMWLVGLSQDVRDRIQGYFNDPLGMNDTEPKSRAILTMEGLPQPKPGQSKTPLTEAYKSERSTFDSLEQSLKKSMSMDKALKELLQGVRISQTADGLKLEFVETKGAVFFESGSAVIRPEAARLMAEIAPILAKTGYTMEIEGHTDAQPFAGAPNGNWGLSTERALSLQMALMKGGVKEDQFGAVTGFAARRLLDPKNPTGFTNRRVTILIPRKYMPGDHDKQPGDELRDAIKVGTEPQAVVVRPDPTDILQQEKH